jgi:hypothetical protein
MQHWKWTGRGAAIQPPPYHGPRVYRREEVAGSMSRFGDSNPLPHNPNARIGERFDAPQEAVFAKQSARKHDRSRRNNLAWGRDNSMAVRCVETGEVFPSIRDAAIAMTAEKGNAFTAEHKISNAIKGGTAFGGYRWELVSAGD